MSRRSTVRTRIAVKIDAAGTLRRTAAKARQRTADRGAGKSYLDAARFFIRGARQDRLEFVGGQA